MDRIVASGLLAVNLVVFGHARVVAQAAAPSRPAAQPSAKPTPAGQPAAAKRAASSPKFDALVLEAGKARDAKQLDRAIELYKQALAIRPSWDEGHWNLGTALYEVDRFAEARDAFRKVVAAHPENGTAWALKGLCEFRLKNFDAALEDLLQARKLPITGGRDVLDVARYHAGILLTRAGAVRSGADDPERLRHAGERVARRHRSDGAGGAAHADPARRSPRHEAGPRAPGRAGPLLPGGAPDGRRPQRLRAAGVPLSGYPERPLRLRRLPAGRGARQGHRGLPARAEGVAAEHLREAADRLRLHPQGRVRQGAAVGQGWRRRGADRLRGAACATARRCSRPETSRRH